MTAKICQPGTCPYCGSESIDYHDCGVTGHEQYYYRFWCLDCKKYSEEYYSLVFDITIGQD